MDLLFLSYANSQQSPLATLQEEDERLYGTLSLRVGQRHFWLHRDSFTSIPSIAQYLVLHQDDIVLFHFSGHAERDKLLLHGDVAANAAGLAQLLGRCPKLKLVVLNGCSTRAQADALLQAGVPAVIATSAPVGDRTATQFAITFYQAMGDRHDNIRDAFQSAIGAAQAQSAQPLDAQLQRGVSLDEEDELDDAPLWGLYYRDEGALEWKLPVAGYVPPLDYEPNEKLVERLIAALAPYHAEARKIKEDEDMGIERRAGEKKKVILKSLPHPVSQQLRKLMSKEKGIEDQTFFDKPGADRLRQIGHTYATLIELLAFILLADFWQSLERKPGPEKPAASLAAIQALFARPPGDQQAFDSVALIQSICQIMEANGLPFFLAEFPAASRAFASDTPLAAACRFLDALRYRAASPGGLDNAEAIQISPTAEDKLSTVFAELSFLARYTLSSVRDIRVLKFRFPPAPRFNHRLVKLEQEFMELEEGQEVMDRYMDAASVILQPKAEEEERFLNLSPFIIDESAFDEKAELAKLFFFERYERELDAQRYRHVYKPGDLPLVVRDQKHFRALRAQFDAFAHSVFNQPLNSL
jgi:hypothetical protein